MYEFFGSSDASVVIRPDLTMPIGRFYGLRILNCLVSSTILVMLMKNKQHRGGYQPSHNKLVSKRSTMKVLMPS